MSSGPTIGSTARKTVTAFFDSRTDADEAVSRLHRAGVPRDSIRLVPGKEQASSSSGETQTLGASSEGFWDSLRDLFLPDEDHQTYAEGLSRGGFLVSVSATEGEYEVVLDILDDEGTIDIDERANAWRAEGWSGTSSADALSGSTAESHDWFGNHRLEPWAARHEGRSRPRRDRGGHPGRRGAAPCRQARRQPRKRAHPLLRGRNAR